MQTDGRTEEPEESSSGFSEFGEFAEKYSHLNDRIYGIIAGYIFQGKTCHTFRVDIL